jgi:hypothetical protein
VKTVLAWSEGRFSRTVCLIEEGNAASLRVASKLAYQEYARTQYKGQPVILLERSV